MDDAKINAIIEAVVKELLAAKAISPATAPVMPASAPAPVVAAPAPAWQAPAPAAQSNGHSQPNGRGLTIDLPDPTTPEFRYKPAVKNAKDPEALEALVASTTARIGVGRAGPRPRTASLLLFQADHAVTQDALMRDVDPSLLDSFGLFTVQTCITGGKQE
jgi:ethanolamine ammonia-lyase small subunit